MRGDMSETEARAIAKRLEEVRNGVLTDSGEPVSLREFWKRLTLTWRSGDGPGISYEAVRNYHDTREDGGRHPEPSVQYLARVADTFGFSFEWIAMGARATPASSAEFVAWLAAAPPGTIVSAAAVLRVLVGTQQVSNVPPAGTETGA